MQMRAILIKDDKGPAKNLYLGDAPKPQPWPGELLVKIKAFGVNRGDALQRNGFYPPPEGSSTIMGLEFSGHISEIGADVSGWRVNEEVFGLVGGGAYAEYVTVLASHVLRKPSHLTWAEAAAIPENFLTAYQAIVMYCEVAKDDNVLVHAGASGVGVAAIQLARLYGARTVTATASTQEKLDWLLNMPNGATNTANYRTEDFSTVIKAVTNGKGVDALIDFVGKTHWKKNIDSLAVDGRMTMLGLLSGFQVDSFDLSPILRKRLRIQGSTLRNRSVKYQADLIAQFSSNVLSHIHGEEGDGPLKIYIHKVYPWTQIQDAHQEMEADRSRGKIVVEVV